MPEKTILDNIQWIHIWLAAITAMWGGLVSYFRRIQQGAKFSWLSIGMHLSMSGFAGLMCGLGCMHFNVAAPLTAICTGLAGHMGAEFIKIMEARFQQRLKVGLPDDEAKA